MVAKVVAGYADVDVLGARLQKDHGYGGESQGTDGGKAAAGSDQSGQEEHRCRSQGHHDDLDEHGVLHGAKEHRRERLEQLLALGVDVGVQVLRRLHQPARHHPHVGRDEVVGVGVRAVGRHPHAEIEDPSVGHEHDAPEGEHQGVAPGAGQGAPHRGEDGHGAPPHERSPPAEGAAHLDQGHQRRGPAQPARGQVIEGAHHQGHHRRLGDEDHEPRRDHQGVHAQTEDQDPCPAADHECEQCQ